MTYERSFSCEFLGRITLVAVMGFTDRNPNTQFAPEGRGSSDLETKVALLELKHTMAKSNLVSGEVDQFMFPLGGGANCREVLRMRTGGL